MQMNTNKCMCMLLLLMALMSCGGRKVTTSDTDTETSSEGVAAVGFDADSAYSYVSRQVEFGPRVPNTYPHVACGRWLADELRRHGASVIEQKAELKAFDGTQLNALNIFGQFNPEARDRVLLLAHWDSRPWADRDPDPANRHKAIDGANDGASGVGVLLEIARQLSGKDLKRGVDILFVDAEDWGTDGDDDSWALGTQYFVDNLPVDAYQPTEAILLDMVGGKDAVFCREYFSEKSAPDVAQKIWSLAAAGGYADMFQNRFGSAVTDDHVKLIDKGIRAIDIIEFHPDSDNGFNSRWHTLSDNMEGIDPATLKAVGETVMRYLTIGN